MPQAKLLLVCQCGCTQTLVPCRMQTTVFTSQRMVAHCRCQNTKQKTSAQTDISYMCYTDQAKHDSGYLQYDASK